VRGFFVWFLCVRKIASHSHTIIPHTAFILVYTLIIRPLSLQAVVTTSTATPVRSSGCSKTHSPPRPPTHSPSKQVMHPWHAAKAAPTATSPAAAPWQRLKLPQFRLPAMGSEAAAAAAPAKLEVNFSGKWHKVRFTCSVVLCCACIPCGWQLTAQQQQQQQSVHSRARSATPCACACAVRRLWLQPTEFCNQLSVTTTQKHSNKTHHHAHRRATAPRP
jgi:hypothetical protein